MKKDSRAFVYEIVGFKLLSKYDSLNKSSLFKGIKLWYSPVSESTLTTFKPNQIFKCSVDYSEYQQVVESCINNTFGSY